MESFKINTKAELQGFIGSNWELVTSYLNNVSSNLPLPLYSSVDIRESSNKFAPVDNNLYPAGFNNLCNFDLAVTGDHFKKVLLQHSPNCSHVAILPESNTKNTFYLDHLHTLKTCLENANFTVAIISFDESIFPAGKNSIDLVSHSEFDITIDKVHVQDGQIRSIKDNAGYCMVVLNNDQSSPIDVDWKQIQTTVWPSPFVGWFQRSKVRHFEHYSHVVNDFCKEFKINPDILQAKFLSVSDVDFATKEGLDIIGDNVDNLISMLNKDSKVFIKADQGTYGMGISVVSSGDEIRNMNRKSRNKMDIGKNKIKFKSVIIQEGVETIIKYQDAPAEVTIYLINGQSVGGFMRTNPTRDSNANLNSRGMVFQKFCISEIRQAAEHKEKEATYSVIARLSTIASAYEIKELT